MSWRRWFWGGVFLLFWGLMAGCVSPTPSRPTPGPGTGAPPPTVSATRPPTVPTPTPRPFVKVTFRVHVPPNTPIHQGIVLTEVDELAGLTVNAQRYTMAQGSDGSYFVTLVLPLHSLFVYRYERQTPSGAYVQEHRLSGEPVRYRVLRVSGPMMVEDVVARWTDTPYVGPPPGRLQGKVVDKTTDHPVAHALVFVAGYQVLTNALGQYVIEDIPPGLHNVVVMDLDGKYRVFQQLAEIASNATTPADIPLQPARMVTVTFQVYPPAHTPAGAPLRLVGHWYRLGNSFGTLRGGMSVAPGRAPQLRYTDEGYYTLTLSLPAEEELRYRFTLGDGLLNAELDAQGQLVTRRLLVPNSDALVRAHIARWQWPGVGQVWFEVTVPESTPPEDFISLQIRYNAWSEPLPMWYLGGRRWGYMFFGPLPRSVAYRYCRNEQCEVAHEAGSAGLQGRRVSGTTFPQHLKDEVNSWAYYAPVSSPLSGVTPPAARTPAYLTGLAWTRGYHPSWFPYEPRALRDMAGLGSNAVLFQPTWAAVQHTPFPLFVVEPGRNPLTPDVVRWLRLAREKGLQPWLFPQVQYPEDRPMDWWQQAARDYPWWAAWFERHGAFLVHHAVLAQEHNAAALVVGGWEGWWSFPERELAPGVVSGAPLDAEQRWVALLETLKSRYVGPLYWAVPDPHLEVPPGIAEKVDGFLLLWVPPRVTEAQAASLEDLIALYRADLETRVGVWAEAVGKPVVVALQFPSARGVLQGCIPSRQDPTQCLAPEALTPPRGATRTDVDTEAQWKGLHAALAALDAQPWVSGVMVFSWYPPVAVQDPSASVHGKPAQHVVAFWFRAWRGQTP